MDPNIKKQALEQVDQGQGRTPLVLFAVGAFFVLAPIFQVVLPAEYVGNINFHYLTQFCLGLLFLYVGALIQERQRLNHAFRDLLGSFEAFNRGLYGDDYRETLQAIGILIQALGSGDADTKEKAVAQLTRLTGQSLPAEQAPWENWWVKHKWQFLSARARRVVEGTEAVAGSEDGPGEGQ